MWVVIIITLSQAMATSVAVPVTSQEVCVELSAELERAFKRKLADKAQVWIVCQYDALLEPLEDFDGFEPRPDAEDL